MATFVRYLLITLQISRTSHIYVIRWCKHIFRKYELTLNQYTVGSGTFNGLKTALYSSCQSSFYQNTHLPFKFSNVSWRHALRPWQIFKIWFVFFFWYIFKCIKMFLLSKENTSSAVVILIHICFNQLVLRSKIFLTHQGGPSVEIFISTFFWLINLSVL